MSAKPRWHARWPNPSGCSFSACNSPRTCCRRTSWGLDLSTRRRLALVPSGTDFLPGAAGGRDQPGIAAHTVRIARGDGEQQVTIEGERRPLPRPFIVLATQNPLEFHGTYPLPEAQLDRFLSLVPLGYPDAETEVEILYSQRTSHPLDSIVPVMRPEDLVDMQGRVAEVTVEPLVARYVVDIVRRTREEPRVRLGASPRGSLMLFRAAQASAVYSGRGYATPDDVQRVAPFVLPHRLHVTGQARGTTAARHEIVADVLAAVPVPV